MDLVNSFDVSVPIDQAWAVLTDVERIAPCLPGAQLQEIEGDEYRGIVKVKVGPITAQYKGKATFVELDDVAYRAVLDATGRDTRGQGNASATIVAELTPAGDGTHVVVTTDLTVTGKVAQFGRGVLADVSAKLLNQFVDNLETTVLVDLVAAEDADALVDAVVAAEAENVAAALDVATEIVAEAVEEAAELVEEAVEEAVEEVELAMAETGGGRNGQQPAVAEAKVVDAVRRIDSPEPEAIDLLEHAGSPVLKRLLPLVGVTLAVFVVWRLVRRRR
jgi:carbon monoxide dehydrogenase subunit G